MNKGLEIGYDITSSDFPNVAIMQSTLYDGRHMNVCYNSSYLHLVTYTDSVIAQFNVKAVKTPEQSIAFHEKLKQI